MKHDNIHSSIKVTPTPQIIPIPAALIDGAFGISVRAVLLGEAYENDGIIWDIVCVADNETEGEAERLGDKEAERLGDKEAERLGDKEAERLGDKEAERLGDSDPDIETLLDDVCDIEEDSDTLFVNDGDPDIPLVIIQILF